MNGFIDFEITFLDRNLIKAIYCLTLKVFKIEGNKHVYQIDQYYHINIRNIATNNGFRLIQIWDFDWIYNRKFIQTLLKEQLSGVVNYKDYIEENNHLNNDYGFSIDGEQLEPRPKKKVQY